ncbi:hypothetical protein AB0L14_38250 [Streptomyces sp. NPDC052727]
MPVPHQSTGPERYAAGLTAGTVQGRFDFTLGVMIDGLPGARRDA